MKKIGFVGAYDKTDVILSVAKVLAMANKKVLVLDNTITQKCKYVVPVINPTKSYITTYEEIDVAIGFDNMEKLKQYLGLEENEPLEYDFFLIDTDTFEGFSNFSLYSADKNYFATGFDTYTLKKGVEILSQVKRPINMTKILFSQFLTQEEEEYFEYLVLGTRVEWNDEKITFILDSEDYTAITENQRILKIKLKNLSEQYKKNIKYLVNDIDTSIEDRIVKNIIKDL